MAETRLETAQGMITVARWLDQSSGQVRARVPGGSEYSAASWAAVARKIRDDYREVPPTSPYMTIGASRWGQNDSPSLEISTVMRHLSDPKDGRIFELRSDPDQDKQHGRWAETSSPGYVLLGDHERSEDEAWIRWTPQRDRHLRQILNEVHAANMAIQRFLCQDNPQLEASLDRSWTLEEVVATGQALLTQDRLEGMQRAEGDDDE